MKDQFNSISRDGAQLGAFKVIHSLQDLPKGHQVAAVAVAFQMMCQRFKADPRDLLYSASRIIEEAYSDGRGEHIRAVQNYIEGELK